MSQKHDTESGDTPRSQLEALAREIDSLPERQSVPQTAFELLGQERSEGAWQTYLAYFLDPTKPHGLDHTFLEMFLTVLEDEGAVPFPISYYELASKDLLSVETERSIGDGRLDILIHSGTSWFVCLELKVDSPEGRDDNGQWQTERYAADPGLAPPRVDAYDEASYVYLAPADSAASKAEEFSDVAWEELLPSIREFIALRAGTVPNRTLAQLSDYADLLAKELSMTDIDQTTRKHKDLYFEYREEITTVEQAIKPFVDDVLREEWAEELTHGSAQPESLEDYRWRFSSIGTSWGQARIPYWEEAKASESALDIHFEHKPKADLFKQGRLKFRLELEEPDRSTIDTNEGNRYYHFKKDILRKLDEEIDRINHETQWEEIMLDPGSSNKQITEAIYRYTPGDEDGYYRSLAQALDDHTTIADVVTRLLGEQDYTQFPKEV